MSKVKRYSFSGTAYKDEDGEFVHVEDFDAQFKLIQENDEKIAELTEDNIESVALLKMQDEEIKRLREALELIKDKAPWCDCTDTAKIADEALSGISTNRRNK